MQFATQSNFQQNPYYQRAGQPPGGAPAPPQQATPEGESFAQRQLRVYGRPQGPAAPPPVAGPQQSTSFTGGSPVQSNGRIAPQAGATSYTPQMAPEGYAPSQYAQYQAPNTQPLEQQANANLWDLLRAPQTLGPEAVAQMKATQQEDALRMAEQNQEQMAAALLSRGLQGGQLDTANRRMLTDTQNQLLSQNRALDLAALQQNRQDELAALGAAQSALSGETARAAQNYQSLLAGQNAQAGEQQFAAQYGLNANQANNQALNAAANLNLQGQTVANALGENQRQYNLDYLLRGLQFGEGQRQYNDSSAQGWSNLNRLSQSDLFRMIFPNGIGY